MLKGSWRKDFDSLIADIKSGKSLALSRWGDGEWSAVLGKRQPHASNCDGHRFFPAMGKELAAVLCSKPPYIMGMQPLANRIFEKPIQAFIRDHDLSDMEWVDADVFHKAAIHGRLDAVLEAVGSRQVVMVGPDHLKRLRYSHINYRTFVDVPPKNAYLSKDRIIQDILAAVDGNDGMKLLVALSASMPAEIILDAVYKKLNGKGHSIIDFGSLWDPLVGVKSRSYMRAANIDAVREDAK